MISFCYAADPPLIEGELVASMDTAVSRACELLAGPQSIDDRNALWSAADELLLYVVHGTLHICGMDDHDDADRRAMRQAEAEVMTRLGIPEIKRFGADSEATEAGS